MAIDFVGILVQGTLISALYALIALGFTMIFGVAGVLNLYHGAMIMIGAYAFGAINRDIIFPSIVIGGPTLEVADFTVSAGDLVGIVVAMLVVAVVGAVLYRGLVTWIEENPVVTFLATIILAVWTQDAIRWVLSQDNQQFGISPFGGVLDLGSAGGEILYHQVVGFVVSWIAIVALWYYVTRTDGGRAIRATAMSERGAELTGVNITAVRTRTWVIAGALAGLAGVFLGANGTVAPEMWLGPLTLAFIIVVIGGFGSIKGSIVAAYVVGFLETTTLIVIGPDFRGILSLVALVLVLLLLPQGFFGRQFAHE